MLNIASLSLSVSDILSPPPLPIASLSMFMSFPFPSFLSVFVYVCYSAPSPPQARGGREGREGGLQRGEMRDMWEKGIAEFLSNAHYINSSLVVLAGNILSFAHVKKNASQDAVTSASKFINDKINKLASLHAA